MFKNKKGTTSISIVLFVLFTLVLVGFTLFSFHIKKVKAESFVCQSFEDIYVKEEKINFYQEKKIFSIQSEEEYIEEIWEPLDLENLDLKEAVELVEGAELVGDEVEIREEFKTEDGKISVVYRFKPKLLNDSVWKAEESKSETKSEKYIDTLYVGDEVKFFLNNEEHTLTLVDLTENKAKIKIETKPVFVELSSGEGIKIDLNNDNYYDLELQLVNIEFEKKRAELLRKMGLEEEVPLIEDTMPEYIRKTVKQNKARKIRKIEVLPYVKSQKIFLIFIADCDTIMYQINKKDYFLIDELNKDEVVFGPTTTTKTKGNFYEEINLQLERNTYYVTAWCINEFGSQISKVFVESFDTRPFISSYEEMPKEEEFVSKVQEAREDLIENLPSRPKLPRIHYNCVLDEGYWDETFAPCGPRALYFAFRALGKEINLCDLIKKRSGGLKRGFLSIFDRRAKQITWPSEICKIARSYNFKCEEISGKDANRDTMMRESKENSVVIARIKWPEKFWPLLFGGINMQHYTIFDTDKAKYSGGIEIYYDDSPPNSEIKELYIIRKI